jgi:predicted nucleotidyltransferase
VVPELKPFARRIAVFGSFVRGDLTPDSDIDLLVRLKPPGERPVLGLKWFGLEEKLGELLGRNVDLVSEDALSPYLRPHIERQMVVLYNEEG